MALIAIAEMFGLGGRRAELVELLERFEREAAGSPGCMRYRFAATLADRDRFLLVSEWQDRWALDAHYRSRAFAEFQLELHGLLAQESELTVYSADTALRPVSSSPMDPRDAD